MAQLIQNLTEQKDGTQKFKTNRNANQNMQKSLLNSSSTPPAFITHSSKVKGL